jgi:prepilin-type N-terminal cleavage/methylation domain-containing protein
VSTPGRVAAARQAGFSLLELLVTLIVVVLMTSLVTLNIGSGGRGIRLEGQLRDLAGAAAYALDEAQMLGVDYGLLLYRELVEGELLYAYSWRERRPEGWREPASGKDIFAPGRLPGDLELALELEGTAVEELSSQQIGQATPQVIFYASGEVVDGAIDVRRRDSGELLWRLEWDLLGRFELQRGGDI